MRDGHGSYITIMGILTCNNMYIYTRMFIHWEYILVLYGMYNIYIYISYNTYIYICISHLGNVGDNEGFLK